MDQKQLLLRKLKNVLKGDAMRVVEDTSISDKDRKMRMEAIVELKYFFDDYDNNMAIIKKEKNIER